jgi:cyclic-di-AMP phosphodiesterase PgpH
VATKPPDEENLAGRFLAAVGRIGGFRRPAMVLGVFLVLFALIALDFSPRSVTGVEVDKPSSITIRADRPVTLVDEARTQELRARAAARVPPVYRYDQDSPAEAKKRIGHVFHELRQIRLNRGLSDSAKNQAVIELAPEITEPDSGWLLSRTHAELNELEKKTIELNSMIMTEEITREQLPAKREEVKRRAVAIEDPQAGRAAGLIAADSVRANNFIDTRLTDRAIDDAVNSVKPVLVRKLNNETIVTEGEIVTPIQLQLLRELGLTGGLISGNGQVLGQTIVVLALILLGLIYLREFQPRVYADDRLLLLVFLILAVSAALAKGLAPVFPPYVIPVTAAAMLTTILVRPSAGIMMAITAGLVTGIIVDSPQYWMFAFITGLFSVYLSAHASNRSELTKAGLWLTMASGVMALSVSLIRGNTGLAVVENAGWGVLGGFAAVILTMGGLQFFEYAFNITTDMKLLELSNPTQPLLKELMVNAPGTYNHSIITGNLVEGAAQQVGANPLLARAGAYYHDIGKIRRPFFFVENQYGDNPHDKTQPNLSYLIIAAHVKEGLELAKKHRLPPEIIDIICQHHGTTLVSYFYSRAKETEINTSVEERQFRYQGEKPKSKEAALIMLADAAEAAVRAMPKPTHNRIEQRIRKIVKERLRDGQLDCSDLTLGHLEIIIKSYTQTMTTMYHSRIEYPAVDRPPRKKRVVVGSFGRKSVGRRDGLAGP